MFSRLVLSFQGLDDLCKGESLHESYSHYRPPRRLSPAKAGFFMTRRIDNERI